jgi:hypothetical protein
MSAAPISIRFDLIRALHLLLPWFVAGGKPTTHDNSKLSLRFAQGTAEVRIRNAVSQFRRPKM